MSEDIKNEEVKEDEKKEVEIKKGFTVDELLNDIGSGAVIHEAVVLGRQFFIKELSLMEILNIHGKSVRLDGSGQITRDIVVEGKNKAIYSITTAVVKGEHNPEPLFTEKQVNSLIMNAKANDLIEGLMAYIMTINPDLKNS